MIYVVINIPYYVPMDSDAGSILITRSLLSFLVYTWNMICSHADLHVIFSDENSLFSKSVSFHSYSVTHLPEIGSPAQKMIEIYFAVDDSSLL